MKKIIIAAMLAGVATSAYAQPSTSPAAPSPPGQPATETRSSAPITDSKAFVETAAVLKNLDLLIACDTAIIHVAGALGVPVWVALGNVPDWRWLLGRSDSPAYPSMRLFRQERFGDWPGVFKQVTDALTSDL